MKPSLDKAFGYQGNNMNLPVRDVAAALPFYEMTLGFVVQSRSDGPPKSAVLARDQIQMALVENGGDPSQDGCAFHVKGLDALLAEFKTNGLQKEISDFSTGATRRRYVEGVLCCRAGRALLLVRRAAARLGEIRGRSPNSLRDSSRRRRAQKHMVSVPEFLQQTTFFLGAFMDK